MMSIREMQKEDCAKVHALQCQCFSVPWSLHSVEEMLSQPAYMNYVAADGEDLVGYVGMMTILDEAEITNVAVDSSQRRQGIGEALLAKLLGRAQREGIQRIFLEVRASNEAAIALYAKMGFAQISIRKEYYTKPKEDAHIMLWEQNETSTREMISE